MRMRIVLLVSLLLAAPGFGQLNKPSAYTISQAPYWAQLMYEDHPNVFEVEQAYTTYFQQNSFEKSYHTQYYKRWRRMVDPYLMPNGSYVLPDDAERLERRNELLAEQSFAKSGMWSLHGPIVTYNSNGEIISEQANVYSIDQSQSNPNIMYCGTEPGEVYKSTDQGQTWFNVSLNDPLSGGVYAVEIHPSDPNIVLIGSGGMIFKTADGGITWINVLTNISRSNEILFNPDFPGRVYLASAEGFYVSDDNGSTWTMMYSDETHDVKLNTADASHVYIIKKNSGQSRAEFFRSTDYGSSFTQQSNGWYFSSDPARYDGGARIAVSDADPDRVYAYLIGEAKAGDVGFIGVYRSNDGGVTWSLPNGPDGGPYTATHMNLAIGSPSWQYHQGYYNCAIMASNSNPDHILIGGLNLYRSNDGGSTFESVAGYVGGPLSLHVDMQDFRAYGNEYWITTDGGIYYSSDFFTTSNFESRMYGVHSSDYWGFGQGWNEDITVGGLYHNGNMSSYENWGSNNFLQLGGGEPASGYVNPGESKRVYSSDINGKILPHVIGDPIESVGFGIDPNESYWTVESTELEFDPRCYGIAYTGKDHQLWKTTDKGSTFNLFATFGNSASAKVTYIEIAWSKPSIMYVAQQAGSSTGKLWKTTDSGMSWSELPLPVVNNSRKILVQVDPINHNNVWIAFASAQNGQKIYQSTDGGNSWINRSSSVLNNQDVRWISFIGGSNDDVYYATNQTIYRKSAADLDWEDYGDGLPIELSCNIVRPFYRDGKIRIGSYGKGIWESPLANTHMPVAQISVDKLQTSMHCELDTVHYVDHSILNHYNATWEWQFQGGNPSTGNQWKHDVSYSTPGTYLTILTITDSYGNSSVDSLYITVDAYVPSSFVSEDFEQSFIPINWEVFNFDNDLTWEKTTDAGAYGQSASSMIYRGYDYWPGGDYDDIRVSVDLSSVSPTNAELTFDVAYARYASNYSDTLQVLISTDCGTSWTSHFYKGGSDLATSPDLGSYFVPQSNEWRSESIDLSGFIGINDLWISFRGITGWGNNIYVDNVNLQGALKVNNQEYVQQAIQVFPSILDRGGNVQVISGFEGNHLFELYSTGGKQLLRKEINNHTTIQLPTVNTGTYMYVIRTDTYIQRGKLIVK